jgi:hypothetical protein
MITMILLLVLALPQLSAQTEPDAKTLAKINSLMEKVDKAIEKKDGQKAMKLVEEVLVLKADHAPALHQKARFLYGSDPAQTLSLLEQAVVADSSYLGAVKDLAALHYQNAQKLQQTDMNAAAAEYEKAALVKNLESVDKGLMIESLFNSGALRFQAKDLKSAIPVFEKLSSITEPANDKQKNVIRLSFYMLGMAYIQNDQVEPAQKVLKKYIELSSDQPEDAYLPVARFILAESLMTELNARVEQINRDEKEDKVTRIAAIAATRSEIVDYLEKAMAQKPEISESARMYLGNYNYIAGNIDKAIELYEALISDFASSDQIGSYQTFLKEIKEEKSNREKAAKQVIKTGKKK